MIKAFEFFFSNIVSGTTGIDSKILEALQSFGKHHDLKLVFNPLRSLFLLLEYSQSTHVVFFTNL